MLQEKSRLESWKEIAAYLRRSERTVMRWESERGLPVRRVPGLDRSLVYA
jgi:DNA-binding transcriptional regulator YiaG